MNICSCGNQYTESRCDSSFSYAEYLSSEILRSAGSASMIIYVALLGRV